ncbi:MAG TPA: hypothetical protein VNA04_09205, partial [Thermoanaerobaculia bacterium]|nr:hypothetical protein [Thermoanaerobaculia bacterium]
MTGTIMARLRMVCSLLVLVACAAGADAADRAVGGPPGTPPGHVKYIVILRDAATIPHPANRPRPKTPQQPDVAGLGGQVVFSRGELLVVTLA